MDSPIVLITGALTGIGRQTALAFAGTGAKVVISGRRDDAGQAVLAELKALGAEAEFIRVDVRNDDEAASSIRPSPASAGSMSPSTTPEPKASRAR
jgi:NADP-dependent 3-hydroxy acid dehydrogenase YdfG